MIRQFATLAQYQFAVSFVQQGYAMHWLRPRSKAPVENGWSTAPIATADDLRSTYRNGLNIGVRLGHWSTPAPGIGLVALDVDIDALAHQCDALTALEALLPDSLTIPIVLSGSGNGSRHLWFSCPLDSLPPKANITILQGTGWKVEALSTGKQLVCPPSIHPDTGAEYEWLVPLSGPPPLIPAAVLQAVENALEVQAEPSIRTEARRPRTFYSRPGDDFNQRADWAQILEPHGWKAVRQRGEVTYWRRPGKRHSISATTGYAGTHYLYIFSSNAAPFEADRAYSPFSAYVLLEHADDFKSAARALQNQGYGVQRKYGLRTITTRDPRDILRTVAAGEVKKWY